MPHHTEKKVLSFWKIPALRQTFVILGPMSLIFSSGMFMGTVTVMMPQLRKNESDIYVSDSMSAWIYSITGFGSLPGVLLIPYLSQWKGYKVVFIITSLPMIAAFFLHIFSTTTVHLLIAGLCQGFTTGAIAVGVMAITEFAEPRLRSLFLVLKSASFFWGVWIANIIGIFANWKYIPLYGIWPALFALVSSFTWPEGPYWLASVGRMDECKKSFEWLRGPGNSTDELASIIKSQTNKQETVVKDNLVTRIRKAVVLREFYMPLLVNLALNFLYVTSGKLVMTVYALVIIEDITKNESMAYIGMIIIDGVTVLGMYIGSYVAMKVPRRKMFLITSAATIFFLYTLCAYLSLVEFEIVTRNEIASLTLLVLYTFAVSWGPMILTSSYLSEILPMRFKSCIISTVLTLFWVLQTGNLRIVPILMENIGMHGTFGIYGTLMLAALLFLYKNLPETSNKTLQELELYFVKDINKNVSETDAVVVS